MKITQQKRCKDNHSSIILFGYKVLFISLISLINVFVTKDATASLTQEMSPLVEEVGKIIQDKYIIEGVNTKYLKNSAVDGMLRGLDPYSGYFDEEEFSNFRNNTNGKFYGIGVEMKTDINSDCPILTSVFEGSPAQKAGLLVGDIITHVNDTSVVGKKQNIVAKMIKGKRGTPVKITAYRSSTNETFSRTLRRNEVKIPNVVSKIYKNKIAIMEIKLFNQQTYRDFVEQLEELQKQYNIKGLILDLRNNPGGLLESAVDIANLFLSNGQLITSVKGRNGTKVFDYIAQNKQNVFGKIKIAVLINKGSASASEILAGCLKDYNIAKLIGETTFGKALVQEVFKLNNNKGAVKITTGQYHTPSDKQINGVGITPDIFVQENINKHYDAILQTGIRYIEQNEKNEQQS